ncbi:MAG: DUF4097 family beta strand repeat protein [Clostridiales bacterium]|nr:DUF4097 family beta strand repeat protein [Clostridiales bacterium]
MGKNKKRLAIGAGICMAAGLVIGGIGFVIGGRPGFYVTASGIHSYHSKDNSDARLEKTKLDSFSSINLNVPNGDIHIIPSDNYYLEYQLTTQSKEVSYDVADDTFSMNVEGKGGIIGFGFYAFGSMDKQAENYVNLYVPAEQVFEFISVDADCGDVVIGDIEAKSMELELSLGNLDMEAFKGNSFTAELGCGLLKASRIDSRSAVLKNDMGDVFCNALIAQNADLTLGAGDLELGECGADVLSIENSMGNVTIDSLENKTEGTVSMDMGDFSGQYCTFANLKVTNDMGNIVMGLAGTIDDYKMDLTTDLGVVSVPGYGNGSETSRFVSQNKDGAVLNIYNDCGDITLSFLEREQID